MSENELETFESPGGLSRRELMAGAMAAAMAGTVQSTSAANSVVTQEANSWGALYNNNIFKQGITSAYSNVANIQAKLHNLYPQASNMKWGYYQKILFPYSTNIWKTTAAFDNWQYFVDAVRSSLEKQPHHVETPADVANPHDPSEVSAHIADHLDKVVQHGLWEIGVPAKILIYEKERRHHGLNIKWDPPPPWPMGAPPANATLTITIHCPKGGWQGYVTSRNLSPGANKITKFVATWKVPPEPVNKMGSQIIFLFNGLESVSAPGAVGGILQPVLQWTKGTGWAVRNGYIRADFDPLADPSYRILPPLDAEALDKYHTPFYDSQGNTTDNRTYSKGRSVMQNSTIVGTIEYTGDDLSSGLPNYKCYFSVDGQDDPHTLTISGVPELISAVCAIESYKIQNSQDYPSGPITITNIALTQGSSINWVINPPELLLDYKTTYATNAVTFNLV